MHYVWKHKITPLGELYTTDGQSVEIIDPGLHNRNAGPDFFNAKVRIDGQTWVGNIEIHDHSKDWFLHGHDHDSAYDNVILHVAETIDADVVNSKGETLPQLQLNVPQHVAENYHALMATDNYPPCYKIVPHLTRLTVHSWMSALETERLEQKTEAIRQRAERLGGSWEDALFVTLARNYGFGINGDAFEQWAMNLHLNCVAHHRDDLFQIEAMFMGQAGLLDINSVPARHQQAALNDPYFQRMVNEYRYFAHKFSLAPMDYKQWRFLRLRPQNFPHIRISQLANLYYGRRLSLSNLIECTTANEISSLLETHVTPYWGTHYAFGAESPQNNKSMSPFSINLLLINTAVPMLFAYGRHSYKEQL